MRLTNNEVYNLLSETSVGTISPNKDFHMAVNILVAYTHRVRDVHNQLVMKEVENLKNPLYRKLLEDRFISIPISDCVDYIKIISKNIHTMDELQTWFMDFGLKFSRRVDVFGSPSFNPVTNLLTYLEGSTTEEVDEYRRSYLAMIV